MDIRQIGTASSNLQGNFPVQCRTVQPNCTGTCICSGGCRRWGTPDPYRKDIPTFCRQVPDVRNSMVHARCLRGLRSPNIGTHHRGIHFQGISRDGGSQPMGTKHRLQSLGELRIASTRVKKPAHGPCRKEKTRDSCCAIRHHSAACMSAAHMSDLRSPIACIRHTNRTHRPNPTTSTGAPCCIDRSTVVNASRALVFRA